MLTLSYLQSQARHHRLCHPSSRSPRPAHLHPAARRGVPREHPQGQPEEDAAQQGDQPGLYGADDEGLLRRRPDGDLPARVQARHQGEHRVRHPQREGETGSGELMFSQTGIILKSISSFFRRSGIQNFGG